MVLIDTFLIILPIVLAMILVMLVFTGVLPRHYYWAAMPFAIIAAASLYFTA